MGELQRTYDQNKQTLAGQGRQYANQTRSDVESSRSQLVQMLNSSGDADIAGRDAVNRAAALSAAPAFNPINNMFGNVASALAPMFSNSSNNYSGLLGARLFSNPTDRNGSSYIIP